ncbi:SRPBCC family protein [Streptomyces sp. MS1.AVA.1]|uniref:SRPBCC family protein n=1 Tax=Streptomyces machairae TaxID=3134109 RepID=A0ABU8UGH4_9ACTN
MEATPLAESCAGLAEAVGHYAGPGLVPVGKHRIHDVSDGEEQNANWKVIVDNYLEGYHVPVAHPSLMRLLDYQAYTVDVQQNYVLFESRCATSRPRTGPSGSTSGWRPRCRG